MPKAFTDLEGCKTNTVKRSIQTKRNINPLDPVYKMPGHSEPADVAAWTAEGCSMSKPMKTSNVNALNAGKDNEPAKLDAALPPRAQTANMAQRSQKAPSSTASQAQSKYAPPEKLSEAQLARLVSNQTSSC
jgi:hypothetical protein